jgi:hypothetical protein
VSNSQAEIKPFHQVHQVNQAFHEFTPANQEGSIVACATDWWNGEGYDLAITSAQGDKTIPIHMDEWRALLKTAKEAKTNKARIAKTSFKTPIGKDKYRTTEVETQVFADKKTFNTTINDQPNSEEPGLHKTSISLSWEELDGLRETIRMLHEEETKRLRNHPRPKADPKDFFDPFNL